MMLQNDNLTIAAKTDKLNQLVSWFDSDEFSLEVALEKFNEAQALASEIETDLSELKNEITVAKVKFNEAE